MTLFLKRLLVAACTGLVTGCLMVPTLTAGDFATRHVIGFSPDGAFFAFEQYGVQDGSGFPYAEIFVIDTADDTWVEGSPIRVLLKDEQTDLTAARDEARAKAAPLMAKLRITEPGRNLAGNPTTELSADPHKVVVNPRAVMPPVDRPVTFILAEYLLPSGECARYTNEPTKGFALTMEREGNQVVEELHRDTDLAASRGCPLTYRIADVLSYGSSANREVWVVLIMILSHGFEGPDGRFIAIAHRSGG